MAAPWDPSAQTLPWDPRAPLQPPPLHTWIPPKPSYEQAFHQQAAEISLWTVVAAMQAVERKVDLQAGRLCGLERRAGLAEKKLFGVEKAVAEFIPHLDALGTLTREYGQLQERLENMESHLRKLNFWILGLPPDSGGEISQVPVNLNEVSIYFSEQEWESLEQMPEDLLRNGGVSLSGGGASSKPGVLSQTEEGEELRGESREECSGDVEESQQGAPVADGDSPRQLDIAPTLVDKRGSEERAALGEKSPGTGLPSSKWPRAESEPGSLAELPPPLDRGVVHFLEEGRRAVLRGGPEEPAAESRRSFTTIVVQEGALPGEAPFVCPECKKSFLYEEQCLLHRQTHFPGLAQQPGAGGYTRPEAGLKRPRLWHARERLHTCPECQKSFRLKIHLHLHERTHSASRKVGSYICGECGRSFSHHSNFLRHQMIHTGERPYACGECGKTFIRKEHLATHRRLHTGERPFCCPLCQKSFTRKQHLVGHQRLHEDVPLQRQPGEWDGASGRCPGGGLFPGGEGPPLAGREGGCLGSREAGSPGGSPNSCPQSQQPEG